MHDALAALFKVFNTIVVLAVPGLEKSPSPVRRCVFYQLRATPAAVIGKHRYTQTETSYYNIDVDGDYANVAS